jgi:hypothetical protein
MEISEAMLEYYLSFLTVAWFANQNLPPQDFAAYGPTLDTVRVIATRKGDMEALCAGLDHLLSREDTDWERYSGGRFPFAPEEVRQIAAHLHDTLWPERGVAAPAGLRLIPMEEMTVEQWWERPR